jgi:UDP-N-acetylmuramyl pentapeptide phosphotransferase/UDP-N-acetylglucosamine-1-phosphate transferase
VKILLLLSFNLLLIYLLNKIFIKKNILLDRKILSHKNFVSSDVVPISGGFIIIINLLILNSNFLNNIFFFGMFCLGLLSDLLILKKPLKKFLFQAVIVITFSFFLGISISTTKIFFIDYLIKYKLFALLFTSFCLLILINGSNFLDGINTLVCGYYTLIILVILYLGHYDKINYNFENFINLLVSLIVIILFNFFSKTYLGDSGTFLLSFIIGYQLINLYNTNLNDLKYISPVFILLLLWYPAMENLFSIIRKYFNNKNPSQPDNLHLHHLLFCYLNQKLKNNVNINSYTGIIINLYNFIIFLAAVNFFNKNTYLLFFLIFNIFFYVIIYFFLLKKKFNKN